MKFLLVQDNNDDKQNIIDSISEFLWDSGHEVIKIYSNYNIENREDFDNYDYIITIDDNPRTFQPNNNWSDIKYNKFSIIIRSNKV